MKHLGLFAAGVLFGTAGLKILSSKEAKTVYAHTTAAVLRAKDCVMQTVTTIREGADDIYADAKSINDRRAAEAEPETIEDASADLKSARKSRRAALPVFWRFTAFYEMYHSASVPRAYARASCLPPHVAARGRYSGILSEKCPRRHRRQGL